MPRWFVNRMEHNWCVRASHPSDFPVRECSVNTPKKKGTKTVPLENGAFFDKKGTILVPLGYQNEVVSPDERAPFSETVRQGHHFSKKG